MGQRITATIDSNTMSCRLAIALITLGIGKLCFYCGTMILGIRNI